MSQRTQQRGVTSAAGVARSLPGRSTGDGGETSAVKIPRLFTIGYQGSTPGDLIDRLRDAGVERVVDVRELPLSRRPGFSKSPLAAALASAGIEYEHVRALGNPKLNRDRWKSGDLKGGAHAFRRHLHNGSRAVLDELAESVQTEKICLLCVEKSHVECHRSLIAGAVAESLPRVAVVHL
jgi:uncharacterized protein (DUF488 family)